MLPHQQRVIEEKRELDERLTSLLSLVLSPEFTDLAPTEQQLLREQFECMWDYSGILLARIAYYRE